MDLNNGRLVLESTNDLLMVSHANEFGHRMDARRVISMAGRLPVLLSSSDTNGIIGTFVSTVEKANSAGADADVKREGIIAARHLGVIAQLGVQASTREGVLNNVVDQSLTLLADIRDAVAANDPGETPPAS